MRSGEEKWKQSERSFSSNHTVLITLPARFWCHYIQRIAAAAFSLFDSAEQLALPLGWILAHPSQHLHCIRA